MKKLDIDATMDLSSEEIDSLRQAFGKTVITASGFKFKSTWYEHPYRDARGKLRSWASYDRIARR